MRGKLLTWAPMAKMSWPKVMKEENRTFIQRAPNQSTK